MNYVNVTDEAGGRFFTSDLQGPVVMLNLLKFRKEAVFSAGQGPGTPMTGEQAYQLYMKYTRPFLAEAGSEVLFFGKGGPFLIGPDDGGWDLVLLVKHTSKEQFLTFAQNEEYLKTAFYRQAALEDSRLLPIQER